MRPAPAPHSPRHTRSRSAELLYCRCEDRVRAVRLGLPDRAPLDAGGYRVRAQPWHHHRDGQPDPRRRFGRCGARQARDRRRRDRGGGDFRAVAGGVAGAAAGAGGPDTARLRKLRGDAGDRRRQPGAGRACRAGRTAGAQCTLRGPRQRRGRRGDGFAGQLCVGAVGVRVDRRALPAGAGDITVRQGQVAIVDGNRPGDGTGDGVVAPGGDAGCGTIRADGAAHRSPAAGVRRVRRAVPARGCCDAADRRWRIDPARRARAPAFRGHRRLHHGAASGGRAVLALGRAHRRAHRAATAAVAGLGVAAGARRAAGVAARTPHCWSRYRGSAGSAPQCSA